MSILMAELHRKADNCAESPGPDPEDSRHAHAGQGLGAVPLLATLRFMGIKVQFLSDLIALFGDPFVDENAEATLDLLQTW